MYHFGVREVVPLARFRNAMMIRAIARAAIVLATLTVLLSSPETAYAQGTTLAEVRVSGNVRLDRESILYYTTLKPGQPWDEDRAKTDFKKLWDTGFFENADGSRMQRLRRALSGPGPPRRIACLSAARP